MGAVDLVILVESPGSVARGLQRVGRAGHGVGETSRGIIFPKFKGDLLESAVVADECSRGRSRRSRCRRTRSTSWRSSSWRSPSTDRGPLRSSKRSCAAPHRTAA